MRALEPLLLLVIAGALPGVAAPHGPAPQETTEADDFRSRIAPLLERSCHGCHGPETQRGGVRLDTLDPDLLHGADVDEWVDVLSVLGNGEMPPAEVDMPGEDRGAVIEWLSGQIQSASAARRGRTRHSSLRRMTRYEYEYALQDLLGLPYSFADDLPPDPVSEDGFQNSSDALHLSPTQLGAYLEAARAALLAVTVRGERPVPLVWDLPMSDAAAFEFARQDRQREEVRKKHADDPAKREAELAKFEERLGRRPGGAHYEDPASGRLAGQSWAYYGAKYAWAPEARPEFDPSGPMASAEDPGVIAVIPRGRGLIVELGERIPVRGVMRVRVLASRGEEGTSPDPALRLDFGWQASNDSRAVVAVSDADLPVDAAPDAPRTLEFLVHLPEVKLRNWVRETAELGGLPSPSEYIKLVNASVSGGSVHVHRVEVVAPLPGPWPPASHRALLPGPLPGEPEAARARRILESFMPRALRRDLREGELDRKLRLFERLRPAAATFDDAMIEVMAAVLSSPQFLLVGGPAPPEGEGAALAARLATFLWCSTPDDQLLELGSRDLIHHPVILDAVVERMLADPRAERFSKHFVRQWLGLSLLDYLHVDRKAHPRFSPALKRAMEREPVALFRELLATDGSVLSFLDADFVMVDERLARHYGIEGVVGGHFRRVDLPEDSRRGGLLTQAGLLAMNSDGTDSHPLKRGVWVLKSLLNDPPPPPPPAVPEIDLTDPRIAEMTLKERIEDHRNHPACMSCHAKIDPWGIAFEHYDAVGAFRTEVDGRPVDARSVLFNGQVLDGMDGLKAFLLEHRQDQFVRALVHDLATFAVGRPLTFEDRAEIDRITAAVRARGDGLATMVRAVATSDLLRSE